MPHSYLFLVLFILGIFILLSCISFDISKEIVKYSQKIKNSYSQISFLINICALLIFISISCILVFIYLYWYVI